MSFMDLSAEDLDELLRSLHPECFVTSQGDPDIVVTPTTVDKFSTTADNAAMIEASPTATLVVTLAQLPQLPGLIPRGDGETGAVWAEQWERIHRMKDVADKWTLAEDTILLEGVATIGPKWRRIAEKLPERSGNAVRNRFKRLEKLEAARRHNDTTGVVATDTGERLEEARRHNDVTGVAPDTGYERSSVYKCSRCGQPKKHHICLAPEETSRSEEIKTKKSAGRDSQRLTW